MALILRGHPWPEVGHKRRWDDSLVITDQTPILGNITCNDLIHVTHVAFSFKYVSMFAIKAGKFKSPLNELCLLLAVCF